ncbi:hypothetical protein KC640_00390 [Candidatus Dojkabacteria bacterium]|uniref:Uncharacterized protein n=1 Tax=Candidatus Dojkabacteria bacterium TaxID=2099670 RepID=A0A955I6V3_9BACT|nr:hypothetical protein [Candidatus Dojkabacteria bacterium]
MIPDTKVPARKLEVVNTERLYELLSGIFIPFENNLNINSHMELFALAIDSVRETIAKFLETKILPDNQTHVPGLNDYQPLNVFRLLNTVEAKSLIEAIGYSEDEVSALKQILLQVAKNQTTYMEQMIEV